MFNVNSENRFDKQYLFYSAGFKLRAFFITLVLLIFSATGCQMIKNPPDDNKFVDKWLSEAEKSTPSSPMIEDRKTLDVRDKFLDMDDASKAEKSKPLPEIPVTLRLRDVPVATVLRAMARAAGQNLLINESITGNMSVDIQEIPWNHAFEGIIASQGLSWCWQGDVLQVKSMADLKQELDLTALKQNVDQQKLSASRFAPPAARIVSVNYADAEQLCEILTKFLSTDMQGEANGQIAVDKETNSIVMQASGDDLDRLSQMIRHLDRPRAQILIEANIVEATQETAKELGMRWSGQYTRYTSNFMEEFRVVDQSPKPSESFAGPEGLTLSMIAGPLSGNVLYAQLQALQSDGKLNILSSPSITTLDNQMAYTEHGERVPYETTDEEGRPEVEFQDAVLRLEVVPHIIDGEHMKMRIKVKKDQVDFTRTVDGNPLIRAKETETNLVVRHGETIVISGLSKQTLSDIDEGLPALKDIPWLGWLVKGQRKNEEMEEFLIFITPSILGTRTD
jgi:type IV pilus assembly protein PilQ